MVYLSSNKDLLDYQGYFQHKQMQNSNDLREYGKDHYHGLQRDIRCFPTKT